MIKVGKIEYINVLPVYYGFLSGKIPFNYEFVEAVPSKLNELIREGKIDISPVSSYEFIKHSEKYLLLPDLSISSFGEVKSVLFFSKVPIHQLHNKDVWLTKSSMTSRALIEFLLENKYGIKPKYYYYNLKDGDLSKNATAVLAIGDDAFDFMNNKNYRFIYDLGREWKTLYKMPFVFALWAVRRETFGKFPEKVFEVSKLFRESKNYGLSNLSEIAENYGKKVGLSKEKCMEYFKCLNYDLTEIHKKAVEKFASLLGYKLNIDSFIIKK